MGKRDVPMQDKTFSPFCPKQSFPSFKNAVQCFSAIIQLKRTFLIQFYSVSAFHRPQYSTMILSPFIFFYMKYVYLIQAWFTIKFFWGEKLTYSKIKTVFLKIFSYIYTNLQSALHRFCMNHNPDIPIRANKLNSVVFAPSVSWN